MGVKVREKPKGSGVQIPVKTATCSGNNFTTKHPIQFSC
jgi:hypothetical protein